MVFDEPTLDAAQEKCLPDLFQEQLRARPDSIAVVCGTDQITYRELGNISGDVAVYLRHLGAVVDAPVGIFAEPSIDLIAGIWGILFSGSAYLPLSPEYPEARLQYMIKDAGVRVIFCHEKLKTKLRELAPPGIIIVTLVEAVGFAQRHLKTEMQEFSAGPQPNSLAYLIYTSGSTGKPKGVMIEHRSIVNQILWLRGSFKLDQDSIVLQKTPISFDAAQWEILSSCFGSRIVLSGAGSYRDPKQLIETIIKHDITVLQCVPTLLQALLDTDGWRACVSLSKLFSGGEILSKKLALECLSTHPTCDLINLYGPTECTINASAFVVDRDAPAENPSAIPIGSPVTNTEFLILKDRQTLASVGEIGELYIGGTQVARGYINKPDLTDERFVSNPLAAGHSGTRFYRTGDLAHWNADGTVQFVGRADNQVKLRGFRVELDEIRTAIENHDWIQAAAVFVKDNPRTAFHNLIACIELSPKKAALMDQGNHGVHHQAKESRLQVMAQLSGMGCRESEELYGKQVIDLPGKTATEEQRRFVFARKTYRLFDGGSVTRSDLEKLFVRTQNSVKSRELKTLSFIELGQILRYFGQFLSEERLLPKYAYASPGALYATQMYLQLANIAGLRPGYYYYHPVQHQLVLISDGADTDSAEFRLHFIGKKRAIEPIYKNNIQEVLEIETGHMLGVFDRILPHYQLRIGNSNYTPTTITALECADEDYYLGTFDLSGQAQPRSKDPIDIYVQTHPGKIADLPAGQYVYRDGLFEMISEELILKKHVIAINQQAYERSSFGITMINRSDSDWMGYIQLGRKLQHLQMNDLKLGFMSSGYSSRTGNDLAPAVRIESILGTTTGPSYFCLGGRVSDDQIASQGMKEDAVHMMGPAEIIKEDLKNLLPDYMVPNRIVIKDKLPLLINGKVDLKALKASHKTDLDLSDRTEIEPRTLTEERISNIWKELMKRESVSVQDDFFEYGGNSLIGVGLINRINKELQCALPLQALFESPTIEKLARQADSICVEPSSRFVRLSSLVANKPICCWPGLGGYPMSLRPLAAELGFDRPFYGIQAHGINSGEDPFDTVGEMAAEDIKEIKRLQPTGPYTLWGYSFGTRVAFEAAYQLEQSGEDVDNLFLIAPGSPIVRVGQQGLSNDSPGYDNKVYVTILFSVFSQTISGPLLGPCLEAATDDQSFASFVCAHYHSLDLNQVMRIIRIVRSTYESTFTFTELIGRRIAAPITIFKAKGDDCSFIESCSGYSEQAPTVIDLSMDHYSVLKKANVSELVRQIQCRMDLPALKSPMSETRERAAE